MDHTTLGRLRKWLAEHDDKPDATPVRLVLSDGTGDYDPSFGRITGFLHARDDDGDGQYLAVSITDTGSFS